MPGDSNEKKSPFQEIKEEKQHTDRINSSLFGLSDEDLQKVLDFIEGIKKQPKNNHSTLDTQAEAIAETLQEWLLSEEEINQAFETIGNAYNNFKKYPNNSVWRDDLWEFHPECLLFKNKNIRFYVYQKVNWDVVIKCEAYGTTIGKIVVGNSSLLKESFKEYLLSLEKFKGRPYVILHKDWDVYEMIWHKEKYVSLKDLNKSFKSDI